MRLFVKILLSLFVIFFLFLTVKVRACSLSYCWCQHNTGKFNSCSYSWACAIGGCDNEPCSEINSLFSEKVCEVYTGDTQSCGGASKNVMYAKVGNCPAADVPDGSRCDVVGGNLCNSVPLVVQDGDVYSPDLYWDNSENKCVLCGGAKEYGLCGNTTGIFLDCGCSLSFPFPPTCVGYEGVGDSQCELACGADQGCDEEFSSTSWISDTTICNWCNSSCNYGSCSLTDYCVGDIRRYNGQCGSDGCSFSSEDCTTLGPGYTCLNGVCECSDTTVPTTSINPDGIGWVNYDVGFTLTCTDDNSGCKNTYYKIIDDGQSCGTTGYSSGTSGTVSCSAGSVCTKRVCFYSVDNCDSVESTKQSNIFYIDKINPTASVISPADGSWQNEDFSSTFRYSDSGSGLSACEYRVVSAGTETLAWTSAGSCFGSGLVDLIRTITVGSTANCRNEGSNTCTVYVRADDNTGNTGSGSRLFSIDWTPPTSIITDPDPGSWQNEDFNVSVTDSEPGGFAMSGVKTCYYQVYSFDGTNWIQTRATMTRVCNDNVTLTVSSIGDCRDEGTDTCNITVWAEDNAGNVGLSDSRLFSIDWTPPPIIDIVHSPLQPTDVDVVAYNGTADDGAGSGLEEIKIYVDSGAGYSLLGSPCTSPPSPCEHQQGPYNEGDTIWYYANATDKAGNDAQSAIKSFTVISAYPIFTSFQLSGDMNYLNVFWNAKYKAGFDKPLGVNCTLNPLSSGQQCIPFPFIQNPNSGTCAVPNPKYEFSTLASGEGTINNISCVIYDPNDVRVSNLSVETFKPIAFEVSVSPTITTTVGEPFSLPINIKNLGLLTDDYTVEIIPFNFPNLVSIERNYSTITSVKTDEIGSTYARVNLLATIQTLIIKINVTSAISCQHASQCISKTLDITIKGGMYSLPEFDIIGIIQIITIAVLVFCVINLKRKMYL